MRPTHHTHPRRRSDKRRLRRDLAAYAVSSAATTSCVAGVLLAVTFFVTLAYVDVKQVKDAMDTGVPGETSRR
jgi:hypothetical protein